VALGRSWVIASSNRGKLRELASLLADRQIELVSQQELGVEPADETAVTFIENALIKARHAAERTGLTALADDSGLVVDALAGAPGVRSARFAGPSASDADNIAALLAELQGIPLERRTARFHCTIVLLRSAMDPAPLIAQGDWEGHIVDAPRGSGGFGYDPVFFDPALEATAAELDPETKARVSHRGRAMAALLETLRLQSS